MARQKLAAKHFAENLELTRSVHERITARAHRTLSDAVHIPIADTSSVQRKDRLDPRCEIQKISYPDIRFVRVRSPFGDRFVDRFVEIQKSVLSSDSGGD